MKPRIKPRADANYYFYNHDGSLIQWEDLSLDQKQSLTRALICIQKLYEYMTKANTPKIDYLLGAYISIVINNLEKIGLEQELANLLKNCKEISDIVKIDFSRFLLIEIPSLKDDIESEARNSFMPNLTRGERS